MECNLPTTYFRDQESRARSTGLSFLPKVVTEYSTRTGISANICRLINPSPSNSRNCCVNTFCEMRGMLRRRFLKRSGFLDSKSHQRITGFQRPPINTSSCSIGHMLAINLALMSTPVTRYPFGAWYLLDGIKRDYMPAGMNSKNDAQHRTPTADVKSRMSRSPRQKERLHHEGHQQHPNGRKRAASEYRRNKVRQSCQPVPLWNLVVASRFCHTARCGDFYTAHWPEPIPLVQLH